MVQYSIQNLSGYLIYHKLGTCKLRLHRSNFSHSLHNVCSYLLFALSCSCPSKSLTCPKRQKATYTNTQDKETVCTAQCGSPSGLPTSFELHPHGRIQRGDCDRTAHDASPHLLHPEKVPRHTLPLCVVKYLLFHGTKFAYYLQHPKCKCILVHVYLKMAD